MPNHHEIKIHLVGGLSVETETAPILHVGDTVHYSSLDGKARVFFPASSPYAAFHVSDAEKHTLKTPGRFQFQCFITPTGKTEEIGWSPQNPKAGGEHEVLPV
jgi:hypothetical protein